MYKFEGFKVGDAIRADDFAPRPERPACYIEGVITGVNRDGTRDAPYAHYCVTVYRDVFRGEEITGEPSRIGCVSRVPMESSMDWEGRVQLVA